MSRQGLSPDQSVTLILVLAAFGMAENNVTNRKFLQHSSGSFSSVSAEIVLAHVLRAQSDIRIENGLRDVRQRSERRADDDVNFLDRGKLALKAGHKVERLGDRL